MLKGNKKRGAGTKKELQGKCSDCNYKDNPHIFGVPYNSQCPICGSRNVSYI